MTESANAASGATGASAASDPSAALAATAPAIALPAATEDHNPAWLAERLRRQEATLLSELGIKSKEEARAAIEAARKAEEANKTAEQRAADALAKFEAAEKQLAGSNALLLEQAGRMMMALDATHQAAIRKIAPDSDPSGQLRTIAALAPIWTAQSVAVQAAMAATQTPASGTAPAPSAPGDVALNSPPDHKAIYRDIKSQNPFAAAAYGLSHGDLYTPKA